jgi:hypothetical protein
MYKPIFDDNINDDDLSPLENFISLNDLIHSGGVKADRARRIMNQFSSTTAAKTRDNTSNDSSAAPSSKKAKYYGARRFKT